MCDVLVIGTGTIGTPLIGLLQKQRESLGIGEILMHKRTPQSETTPTIQRLIDHGAKLVVEPEAEGVFRQHGLLPAMMRNDALAQAEVVVDCTPAGNAHKDGVPDGEASWFRPYEGNVTRFIA